MPRLVSRQTVLAAAAGLLMSSASVLGQLSHTAPADRNAALAYSTLFYSDMPKELTEAVDAADLNEVGLEADPAKQPEKFKAAAQQVKDRQGAIRRYMAATKLKKCDFEIAYESGFNALLSHLGPMRKAARMLRVDARRLLLEGDADAAAERTAALYRMARHMKSDDTLISSLVGMAIAGLGNSESEVLLKSGRLTATGRETILTAIAELGRTDPYGVKEAVMGERLISVQWVRDKFPAPVSGRTFAKTMEKEWGMIPGSREELVQIEAMDDAAFAKSLAQLDEYYIMIQSQWDLPDAAARLDVMAARIADGTHGPLAKFLAPSFSKARQGQSKGEAELDAMTKRLKDYVPPAAPVGGK